MSFQAYLDNIKAKTGKTPEDFRKLAGQKGLADRAGIMAWLKKEYGLGYGHAHLVAHLALNHGKKEPSGKERLDGLFAGAKAKWRKPYDRLASKLAKFGTDVGVSSTDTYVSLLRGGRKFGIAQPSTADRFDVGIKLKGTPPAGRFKAAGKWNGMVTHRVSIGDPGQLDGELVGWLKRAYDAAK